MDWVLRLHSCQDLGPLLPEFEKWLSTNPGNREEFGELWDIWQGLGTLKGHGGSRVSVSPQSPPQ